MDSAFFDEAYKGRPLWEIGEPQPAFADVIVRGLVRSPVLEVGCGTGENLLQMAALGHEAWGIDISRKAIAQARRKAVERDLPARFELGDALARRGYGPRFNTILDSGFFHGLDDAEREDYVQRVSRWLRPGGVLAILCFSDHDPFAVGPRRITVPELMVTFHPTFGPPDVRAAWFIVNPHGGVTKHRAWLATMRRRRSRPTRARAASASGWTMDP